MSKLFILLAVLGLFQLVLAGFWYNPVPPKEDELSDKGLKCIPGRTVIRVQEKNVETLSNNLQSDSEDDDVVRRSLRTHMNSPAKDESCKVCVCSTEGKDEYCSKRPAANVNECLRMAQIMADFQRNEPFDHDRDITQMIRRGADWIWHETDFRTPPKTKCRRGVSYYSNSPNANDTDIEKPSDVESLVEYNNRTICFFCICSASGNELSCISRNQYYCDYIRYLNREDSAMRHVYTTMFKQDRPGYYRTLSYRLRRTMDEGLYGLIETAGPAGDAPCIPFVSQYSDCTSINQCTGCTRCTCTKEAKWSCNKVAECPKRLNIPNENMVDNAFRTVLQDLNIHKEPALHNKKQKAQYKEDPKDDVLLDNGSAYEQQLASLLREKRSVKEDSSSNKANKDNESNNTIKFYHTLDEVNEDTLKGNDTTGTLEAKKIDMDHLLSRRTDILGRNSSDNLFQVDYSGNTFNGIDNKIDGNHSDNAIDLGQEKLRALTNYTQKEKDKDLSKIVVNELKNGTEVIGDKNAPVMSNITFTPENDTLTAMAFIAGNLLNKLWSIEKDSSGESMEIEALKTEKLKDLLELFKEPLTMRQEAFLKNALETLSRAIEKHRDTKNVTLCDSINDAKKYLEDPSSTWEKSELPTTVVQDSKTRKKAATEPPVGLEKKATVKAIEKINHVMALIKKYESVTKNLGNLKKSSKKRNKKVKSEAKSDDSDDNEDVQDKDNLSMNMFGNILEKVTKLLLPYKKGNKMLNKIRNFHVFHNKDDNVKEKLKKAFHMNVGNITSKDKIILDYLSKIKNNPRSLLDDNMSNEVPTSYLEGDILLNLSEFFKIKSMVDLLKLMDGKKSDKEEKKSLRQNVITTECSTCHLNQESKSDKSETESQSENEQSELSEHSDVQISDSSTTKPTKSITNIKDKLKSHLKTILDDLMELQKGTGAPKVDGDLANSIADAFPCIYNMLKSESIFNTTESVKKTEDPITKVSKVYDALKKEYSVKIPVEGRRMDENELLLIDENTPKSGLVWERVIQNVDEDFKKATRRTIGAKIPLTFEEIKEKIDDIEATTGSNVYKTFSTISEIPPSEKIMLLRTLYADVLRHIDVLRDIKASLDIISTQPDEKKQEVIDFVDSAAMSLGLNKKVVDTLEKVKFAKSQAVTISTPLEYFVDTPSQANKQITSTKEEVIEQSNKNIKLTRDEVLNQLIKNRVTLYLKMKQNRNEDYDNDPNYGIAKNILQNLEHGNSKLARQLYKIFVTSKQENSVNTVNDKANNKINDRINEKFSEKISPSYSDKISDKLVSSYSDKFSEKLTAPAPPAFPEALLQLRRQSILDKEPVVHFEDPRAFSSQLMQAQRDQMVRNLLNSKNFKLL